MLHYIIGDLLDTPCDYIAHGVNVLGVMGAGVAYQIKVKYPQVFAEYALICKASMKKLGTNHTSGKIINMFVQPSIGRTGKHIVYPFLEKCLTQALETSNSIAVPLVGVGLGGGNLEETLDCYEKVCRDTKKNLYCYIHPNDKNHIRKLFTTIRSQTCVVNKHKLEEVTPNWEKLPIYKYIGRPTILGNPYPIPGHERKESIQAFKSNFNNYLRNKNFLSELLNCFGKSMVCFCKPLDCHGDILLDWLQGITVEEYLNSL